VSASAKGKVRGVRGKLGETPMNPTHHGTESYTHVPTSRTHSDTATKKENEKCPRHTIAFFDTWSTRFENFYACILMKQAISLTTNYTSCRT
jgi:hypothetical protein